MTTNDLYTQCAANTAKGQRCTREVAKTGDILCSQHAHRYADVITLDWLLEQLRDAPPSAVPYWLDQARNIFGEAGENLVAERLVAEERPRDAMVAAVKAYAHARDMTRQFLIEQLNIPERR
jgi:hypothetical protein